MNRYLGRLHRFWNRLRGGFWLLPAVITIILMVLAFVMVAIDRTEGTQVVSEALGLPRIGVEGARSVLSTIAGGMMTVASVVFSLTFVALTTMAGQLGPRILTHFMRDRPTQMVLGLFIGCFVYALVVLTTTGAGTGDTDFAPGMSLAVAIALAIIAFGVMIYFVHHIARSLQADEIVAQLGAQFINAVERALQDRKPDETPGGIDASVEHIEARLSERHHVLPAPGSGYIQHIDYQELVRAGREAGGCVRILCRGNDYVVRGVPMARFMCADAMCEAYTAALDGAITIAPQRTPDQQARFEVAALVEVALRALSPGINDPFTAIACVHQLTSGLARFSHGEPLPRILLDDTHEIRVVRPEETLSHYLDSAFAPIVFAARGDALVVGAVIEAYTTLAGLIRNKKDRAALADNVDTLEIDIDNHFPNPKDRERLGKRIRAIRETGL